MEAIKLDDLCKWTESDRGTIDEMRRKLGIKCQKRDNVWTITNDEAMVLCRELDLPQEWQSKTYFAKGLHPAPNKNWLMCKIDGQEGKQPVLVPRRLVGRLTNKRFGVEKIEDKNGITWRHEYFRRLKSYNG